MVVNFLARAKISIIELFIGIKKSGLVVVTRML